jgi:hypothetical protein
MTEREPNLAVEVKCGAYPGFGARSPAWGYPGPARRVPNFITHEALSSPLSSLPEDSDLRLASTRNMGKRLAQFARILLAIAYVREKDATQARELRRGCHEIFWKILFWAGNWRGGIETAATKCLENQVRSPEIYSAVTFL